jgi:hypothetical protein
MARLCIRIEPNTHPDPALNVLRTHVGDVVDMREDGHVWSPAEQACGQYRFLDLPGVLTEDMLALVASVVDAEERIIRRRAVTLDAAALKAGAWKTRTQATRAQLTAIIVARTY